MKSFLSGFLAALALAPALRSVHDEPDRRAIHSGRVRSRRQQPSLTSHRRPLGGGLVATVWSSLRASMAVPHTTTLLPLDRGLV